MNFLDNFISCDLFPKCPGCQCQIDVRNPPIQKDSVDFFQKISKKTLQLISKEIYGYRSKIKLAIRGSIEDPQIGLFEENSHKVIDLKSCPLHFAEMNRALEQIRKEIKYFKIEPYRELGHHGRLKYLQMHICLEDRKIQLSLVFKANSLKESEKSFVKQLYKTDLFHSIWIHYHPNENNSIFQQAEDCWELLEGKEDFFQKISNISFAFHPSCFSQAHLSVFEEMIAYIDSLIPPKKSILELYSGVGCIGLSLAQKAEKVTFVESSPFAENCFKKTIENFSEDIKKRCVFISKKVEDCTFSEFDILLVDPPRKGLSKSCKQKIFSQNLNQIVYVSCGFESFKRDCLEFLECGWNLTDHKSFLMFPGCDHIEIVASFQKQ